MAGKWPNRLIVKRLLLCFSVLLTTLLQSMSMDYNAVECGAIQSSTLKLSMWKQRSQAILYNTFIHLLDRILYCVCRYCAVTLVITQTQAKFQRNTQQSLLNRSTVLWNVLYCTSLHSNPLCSITALVCLSNSGTTKYTL